MEDSGQIDAVTHAFGIDMDLGKMGESIPARVLAVVRSWYPDLLKFRFMEWGILSAVGEPASSRRPDLLPGFLAAAAEAIEADADAIGAEVILVRDIPLVRLPDYRELEARGYQPVFGFPIAGHHDQRGAGLRADC